MKSLLTLVMASLLLAGVSNASTFDTIASSKNYRARVVFPNGGPTKGANRIAINITSRSGQPVANALIGIEYLMPSLPGRKPMMTYRTTTRGIGASREASLNLTMTGEWKVILTVTVPPKRAERMAFGIVVN